MHKRKFDSLRLTYLTNETTCKYEYIFEYVHVDFLSPFEHVILLTPFLKRSF